ncbi:PKD domain-containing protein [bacterium]|nr:MAG: PKD domain-containing protein [bacterium]
MMNRIATVTAAAMVAASALAQSGEVIYSPVRSIKDQGISLKGWGSGTMSETDEVAYEGVNSLRFSTRHYFQGGLLTLGNAVDLTKSSSDKNNLLQIVFRSGDGGATSGRPGAGGLGGPSGAGAAGAGSGSGGGLPGAGGKGGGGTPGGQAGGRPGGIPGGPQGGRPGGVPGGAMGGQSGGGSTATPLAFRNLRLVVTTTDGKKSEAYIPVTTNSNGVRGWRMAAVPLQGIAGFDRTNKQIKEIAFSADGVSTVYVGEVKVVNDATPIRGEIAARLRNATPRKQGINLANGDEVDFIGTGMGGSSVLKYTWDFDEADGVDSDAEGQVVKRKFRKSGTYTVTLTISDYFGLKEPYKTTMKVTVN